MPTPPPPGRPSSSGSSTTARSGRRLDRERLRRVGPWLAFAALCYLPLLATRPGWVTADTKTYLYLDPARLLGRAWSMWDPQVGLGTVTHQMIGYLWPMGPWYWTFERLGVPDWVAQRLWWGTLLFAAGAGVVYLLRRFSWPSVAIWPAAVMYALTPYLLTHITRLSGVVMPYAGLPWLVAFTILSIRHRGWRYPALFALVTTTVGPMNLTGLVLVGLGPTLWVIYAAVTRDAPLADIARAVARMGVLTTAVSAWWISGLWVQATHGVEILRYTESAEVVARVSTAFEVVRGLGYWFFYGGDKLQLWVEVSYAYTQRPWLIAVTFLLPTLALLGHALGRWRHQAFAVSLVLVGAIVAIGAHPWDDPTPFGWALQAFFETDRGLAMRSLPRVVPLLALGLALFAGAAIGAVAHRRPAVARGAAAVVIVLAVLGLPPLWQRTLVVDSLSRQEVPDHWFDAADEMTRRDDGTRVLEIPGTDFTAYRWGMTVDPVTPGLTDRPYVARELVPHGAPLGADLLNAFDLRIQERTLEPASIAPVARLLRAGDIVTRNDLEFERYPVARPRAVWDLVLSGAGLDEPIPFGDPIPNEAGPILEMRDEHWLLDEGLLDDPPPVALVPVADVPPILGTKPANGVLLLDGDGAGVVDGAAAGLLHGTELLRYTGSLEPAEIVDAATDGGYLLLTDSNRKRGERWGGLRHNRGHTERADEERLRPDYADNRLPRFPDAGSGAQTVTLQRGGVTIDATASGNEITYAGEERAALAMDGDRRTAWAVGAFADARGERLRVVLDEPLTTDWIRIQQLDPEGRNRSITDLELRFDGSDTQVVRLDPSSWTDPGQRIDIDRREVTSIELTILDDTAGDPPRYGGFGPVGVVELELGPDSPVVDEIIALPTRALDALGQDFADAPFGLVLTRIRQDPTDRTRGDEERSIRRLVDLPVERQTRLSGTVRLSARADASVLDSLLGQEPVGASVTTSEWIDGGRSQRPSAMFDDDPSTAWTTPWGDPTGHPITVDAPAETSVGGVELTVVADGRHSVPRRVVVRLDGQVVADHAVAEIADGDAPQATAVIPIEFEPRPATSVEIEFTEVRAVTSIGWDAGRPLDHPLGVVQVEIDGLDVGVAAPSLTDECRDDLVMVDGRPVPVQITGDLAAALAGAPLDLNTCSDAVDLPAGPVEVLTALGVDTGLDIDQLVFVDGEATAPTAPASVTRVVDQGASHLTANITGLVPGEAVWLVFAQSHSTGWSASLDGDDLGPSDVVDGYANGWLIVPTGSDATVDLRFWPQRRVDVALAVTALGVLAALVLALRRPAVARPDELAAPHPCALPSASAPPLDPVRTVAVVAGVGLASLVVATPPIALIAAVVAAIGARSTRALVPLALLPSGLVGLAGLYVLVWQVRHDIAPGMEWTSELHRAHPIALTGLLLLGVHGVVHRARQRSSRDDPAD